MNLKELGRTGEYQQAFAFSGYERSHTVTALYFLCLLSGVAQVAVYLVNKFRLSV